MRRTIKQFQGLRQGIPAAAKAGVLAFGLAALCGRTAQGVTPTAGSSHAGTAVDVNLAQMKTEDGVFVAPLRAGGKAILTIDPNLQKTADDVFEKFNVPYGAAVVVSIVDGNVLVLSGKSALDAKLGPEDLALKAWAPAASVFKVVSASALVADGGLTSQSKTCYHGGLARIEEDNLRDMPSLDKTCDTLSYGVGKSQNAILAKMASRNLDAVSMRRMATAFGFGLPMPFVAPVETSALDVPKDKLEFARMAAGFFHTSLSPLHGALLAATIAGDGLMPRPRLVQRAVDRQGNALPAPGRRARRVLDPAVAKDVGTMMEATTRMGTARSGFVDGKGRALLPFSVAGKTGSLNYRGRQGDPQPPAGLANGELLYSWFVGYAPADKPEVAFAVLIGNSSKWRIKATFAAQQILAAWGAHRASPAATNDDAMVAQK